MKNKQSFIALFVLFTMACTMVFNACSEPSDGKASDSSPFYFYVDSSGNFTETDSGRTIVLADKKAKVVFYSDNLASGAQRVGFTFDDKCIVFLFKKSQNFPSIIFLSDSEGSYNGNFTPYDSVTETYGLTVEQGTEKETLSNIALSKDTFTQYKDDPELTPSQNLRMRNLYIATCIYASLYDFMASDVTPQAKSILSFINNTVIKFFNNRDVSITVGAINIFAGLIAMYAGYKRGEDELIKVGVMAYKEGIVILWQVITDNKVLAPSEGSSSGGGGGGSSSATVAVTGVSLNKTSVNLVVGSTETLTPTITPENATDKTVSWSSSNDAVATVSSDGKVTGVGVGSAKITVTTSSAGKTASCTVNVSPGPVTGVSLNKTSVSLIVGSTETLIPTITPANAANKSVTWSSSNDAVVTVSSGGTVTGVSVGSATITVKTQDGNKTATCSVRVDPVAVTGVSLNKTTTSMLVGATDTTLSAEVEPHNATNKSVTWSSSDTSVAEVSASGVITSKKVGTATITVKTVDGNKTATCTVNVVTSAVAVTGVSLNKSSVSLNAGNTDTLQATIAPYGATNQNVSWSSSNHAVATVSGGTVTAVGPGTAIITVTTDDGGKTATCTVTVISWDVYDQASWNEVVSRIKNGGNNKTYTINVIDNFSLPGAGLGVYTFGYPDYITVTITGNNKEISLTTGSTGYLLYVPFNQTVIIKDLRLKGHNTNNVPLVHLTNGATTVIMQGSASVSGNTNTDTSSWGGGVYVGSGANFTMQGNSTVSGNNARLGGGVYVDCGNFTMQNNATVSGNTSSSSGGGVYVNNGRIYDDEEDFIFFHDNYSGVFTMKDSATVSGNTSSGSGGGVSVSGDNFFIMEGGTVYGNDVAAPLGNTSSVSGGAALYIEKSKNGQYKVTPIAKYSDGSNILPGTDMYTNNTITGR